MTIAPSHWSSHYIGLPWLLKGRDAAGADCWGVVHLVLREVKGLTLPDYINGYLSTSDRDDLAKLFADTHKPPWVPVTLGAERPFDILVFRRDGLESHIGIVAIEGAMLHIEEGGESHITSYVTGRWRPRLAGIYRHEALV